MKSKRTREPSSLELDLWHRAMEGTKPFAGRGNDKPRKVKKAETETAPKPSMAPVHKPPVPAAAPALARRTEQRVQRGRIEIDRRLDLHGHQRAQARRLLLHFLIDSQRQGARVVLVITGKGMTSRPSSDDAGWFANIEEPGVLRRELPGWLAAPEMRTVISGHSEAHQRHGGSGAFYVMLKRLKT